MTTKGAKAKMADLPAVPKHPHQRAYQDRLHAFRDEAVAQRERVARVEHKLDAVLTLLRGHIDVPKEHSRAAKT
ncbi:hypothetical protein IYW40_04625 [Methylocystis sp. H4A]|uniref:hypothetical protein n=1 Tax=Methylocystis sp. H4A TaxID=2785788 RepID=UPI0018C24AB2|nr:hypothetical protein [Methylocystis sp. H4A]MBG0800778.1 hypothetical protein [Methylocystis sp. H4A]